MMKHLPSWTVDPLKKWATFKDPFHIPLKQPGLPKTEPQRTLRSVAALTWKSYEEIVHSFMAHFFLEFPLKDFLEISVFWTHSSKGKGVFLK